MLAFASLPRAEDDTARDRLDNLKGLYKREPFAAVMIAIAMLSLAGIPPFAGGGGGGEGGGGSEGREEGGRRGGGGEEGGDW